ncbi:MAG: tRNA (adenosine(37)-N6)-dimethylallyltransferase MiaA [Eubacteriales bacterium]|jgi:tRNA dimethylallyltransferase
MPESEKIRILAIVGPTASGKSALAVRLAERLSGEVVSCDSMQIYRGMDIGTAKPTAAEMRGIPHHMIDIAEPSGDFSVADYVEQAEVVVEGILSRGRLPIFCGGTGFYLDSFLRGGFEPAEKDLELRERLWNEARTYGNKFLYARLLTIDPESAEAIHPNNVRRVIRALEIYELTGKTKSEHERLSREAGGKYDPVIIGLNFKDRAELYRRIDMRVDKMLAEGLLEEAERLWRAGVFEKSRTAAQAIGYKELLGYLRGEVALYEAVEKLKQSTRRYAKRQLTWFRANHNINWIEADGKSGDEIADEAALIWERAISADKT